MSFIIDNIEVKMLASLLADVFEHFLMFPGFPIRAVIAEGIPYINDRKYACEQRNLFTP